MGATQRVARIRVFCVRNNDHNVHYWNYPNMPAGWAWQSTAVNDYEIINPTDTERATIEELFTGSPENIAIMRTYLRDIYDQLEEAEVIDQYVITDKITPGQTLWERLFSILKRNN